MKFIILLLLLLVGHSYGCEDYRTLSYQVMDVRQMGYPLSEVLNGLPDDTPVIASLVREAYKFPLKKTESEKEQIKEIFSQNSIIACDLLNTSERNHVKGY